MNLIKKTKILIYSICILIIRNVQEADEKEKFNRVYNVIWQIFNDRKLVPILDIFNESEIFKEENIDNYVNDIISKRETTENNDHTNDDEPKDENIKKITQEFSKMYLKQLFVCRKKLRSSKSLYIYIYNFK